MNPLFLADFYKVGHVSQYPSDTTWVCSNWTPRKSRIKGQDKIVFFGLQYFIKEILQSSWDHWFFERPIGSVLREYRELISATLGIKEPKTDHIEALHRLGYLPITIHALPEGTSVPIRLPALVISNNTPESFWLPNYLETILSNILWKPCTSATTAQAYRRLFTEYAIGAGEKDLGFIDWQGHDFSMRGMSGREDSILSGMGHLLSFSGTDTIPAIVGARKYYGASLSCGGSVPATEHSVMCAGGEEDELETFKRLITETYPSGIVSIVSDTWDLWKVLDEYVPALKDVILARDGKVVFRPDSGDPVKIICGDPGSSDERVRLGAARLLAKHLGTTDKKINKAGLIYGDSISLERADNILRGLVAGGLSPFNVVFGIGSFTYEYVTRDTFGFAMKATAVERDRTIKGIFKKPVTDDGEKFSLKGIPVVLVGETGELYVKETLDPRELDNCEYQRVYADGELLVEENFETIRKRVRE